LLFPIAGNYLRLLDYIQYGEKMATIDDDLKTSVKYLEQILEREGKADELEQLRCGGSKVWIIKGEHDSVESVFDAMQIPYVLATASTVNEQGFTFGNAQAVFINCSGNKIDRSGLNSIENYVTKGGRLITTDWAVESIIERAFPGTIRRLGDRKTNDEVVIVEPIGEVGASMIGLDYEGAEPKWWLESASYPIEIIDDKVIPIISSKEMEARHGSPHIAVMFNYGKGNVMHFVSHLKAQRREIRNARDAQNASCFSTLTGSNDPKYVPKGTSLSGLETGYSSVKTVYESVTGGREQQHAEPTLEEIGEAARNCYSIELTPLNFKSVQFKDYRELTENGAMYDLRDGPVTIGSKQKNKVCIPVKGISRKHAMIMYNSPVARLEDLESTHFTFLDGHLIENIDLPESGVIDLGNFAKLSYRLS